MSGSVPSGWAMVEFDSFTTLQRGKDLTKAEFRDGTVPVAGSNGVIGYHDTAIAKAPGVTVGRSGSAGKVTVYEEDFWPHNTSLYVRDFHGNDPYFAGFLLGSLNLSRFKTGASVPTLDRNSFKTLPILVPPLPEQKKIAHILSTVQRAIEAQERIIQTTTELKKALMHKLFTEGLRNEPQKQTEIGLVPESWEVIRCEDVCDTINVGIVVKPSSYYVANGVPAFRSQNVREDRIQPEPMVYISEEANNGPVTKSKLSAGDVLIVRTGYPGTSCVVPPKFDGSNCIDLIFVRPNKAKLRSHYLSRFFNSDAAKVQVQAGKIGLAQQHFNVGAVKNTQMPLPPMDQQDEIVAHLELIDSKHDLATSKRNALQDLFRTLLHELMTAKTRVHELEISNGGDAS
jgi:type I restriction enzyme S subunit